MIVFPNAKINIGLNITSKRADGYHNLETVFYPTQFCDILEIIPDKSLSKMDLEISGIELDHDLGNNLVEKAWKILNEKYNIGGCKAILHKIIPFGAGLGGGSADAAFCLKALNALFKLNLSNEMLKNYASQIGADCAFFIDNTPSLATGIGDVLSPIDVNLEDKYLVLIKPPFAVPTKDAYSGIQAKTPELSLSISISKPISDWKTSIKNDFEGSVFSKYPAVEDLKNELYKQGAIYASMSGSGSSVYGIFNQKPELNQSIPADYFVWEEEL